MIRQDTLEGKWGKANERIFFKLGNVAGILKEMRMGKWEQYTERTLDFVKFVDRRKSTTDKEIHADCFNPHNYIKTKRGHFVSVCS